MLDIEVAVAKIGAESDGIVLAAEADRRGVGADARRHLRERGVLIHVARGVDRLRDHPVTWRTRCRITLAIAGPGAVLGLRSAARMHRCYAYRYCDAVEVLVPRSRDHATTFGRIVQTRWLPADHVTVVDGLPCTTLARTFFDLCGDPEDDLPVAHPAHERRMTRVYNDAVGRRGLSFTQEAATLLVMAKRGRAGTVLVRRILRRFGPKYTPTRSDLETVFLELVDTYGIAAPGQQVPLSDERGWIGTVDFCWHDARLVVEIDSSWHDGPLDMEEDAERDERLRAAGYTVKRYRYGDLVLDPARVARELGMVVGAPGPTTIPNSRSGAR